MCSSFPTSAILSWPFFFTQEQNEMQIKHMLESNILLPSPSSLSYGAEFFLFLDISNQNVTVRPFIFGRS